LTNRAGGNHWKTVLHWYQSNHKNFINLMNIISTFYQNLSTGWHPMRWVALALGLFLGYN
jgi:hypothetical protein